MRRTGVGATIAENERFAGFHLQQGDKKQAQVMIHPLSVCPELATGRAPTGNVIQFSDFGLNACYQKHLPDNPLATSGSWFLRNGLEFCNIWNTFVAAVN